MGKIAISENITIDGVIDDPTGDQGTRFGGWFDQLAEDLEAWAKVELEEALAADALLMGRRTYEYLIARGWLTRTGEWADRLRSIPKYVVSSTLENPDWDNTTVLAGDVVSVASKLKDEIDGDIVVHASGQLVRPLLEHDLADELRLMLFPFVLGDGERLFRDISDPKPMRLTGTRTVGNGLTLLTYQPIHDA